MKHIVCAAFLSLIFCLSAAAEDIYDIQLKSIDGSKIDLSLYRGKKMLIIVLPGSQADGNMTIAKLTQLAGRYGDSVVIIGVPAQEWGYAAGSKDSLKVLYKDLPPNFILAEGMKVRKNGELQSPIFKWLTDKNQNGVYNRDVPGVGEKFFIDEKGKLYGVLGASLPLDSPLMDRILRKTKPR